MDNPKHTPGPWHRNIKPAKKYNTVYAGRNTHVAHLDVAGLTDEQIEANCDLIAAAPSLLAALKALQTWSWSQRWADREADMWHAADAAIAKAEGKPVDR
jgi:hypothetical protein